MRILVTGGAGFLGSHFCAYLLGRGDEVICMDNLITGTLDYITDLFVNDNFAFIKHDVTEYVHVPGKLDHVVHLASLASPKAYQKYPKLDCTPCTGQKDKTH